jgi:hypothetical protein
MHLFKGIFVPAILQSQISSEFNVFISEFGFYKVYIFGYG